MTEKEALEKANRLYELIVPKLEAVENSGNSSLIHDSLNWICKIKGEKHLISYYKDLSRVHIYYRILIEAESWLIKIGEKL